MKPKHLSGCLHVLFQAARLVLHCHTLTGPFQCMQGIAAMDQVLLEWDGGHRELLARVTDAEGTWLCLREVHSKLGSNVSRQTWHKHIKQGEHTAHAFPCIVFVVLSGMCTITDAWLPWLAEGQGCRPATSVELGFLKGADAIKANAPTAVLITVELAINGCGKARVAAALLAAMEGIAELGPHTAPVHQEAAPLQQLPGGTATHALMTCCIDHTAMNGCAAPAAH